MNAKEAGEKFLNELLAHVPADKQAAAREALATSDAALTALGDGVLRQSEFSRAMDDARTAEERAKAWHTELDGWYAAEQARLAAAAANPTPSPNPNPTPGSPIQSPANVLTREDLAKELGPLQQ